MEEAPLLRKMPTRPQDARRRYLSGIGLLLAVILLWTGSNFITADLETGEDSWNKPFLITYLNTSSFALYLVPKAFRYLRRRGVKREEGYVPLPTETPPAPFRPTLRSRSPLPVVRTAPLSRIDSPPRAAARTPLGETTKTAAYWGAAWFVANWSLNASLAWTSVASVTIISSTSSFFTLGLGRLFGVEALTRTKVAAVAASFAGVVLVTRSDSTVTAATEIADLPTHPILGDFACLVSAAFYAVYSIYIKIRVPDEERTDMQLVLGLAGLFNIVCLIPVFPILHYLSWETFQLPPSPQAVTICLINMAITFSSDYIYVLAMLKTGPMLTTIGLSLTIPLALVISFFAPHSSSEAITPLTIAGAALVCVSFTVLGLQGLEETRQVVEADTEDDEERQ
ncbi:hypothetical protein Q5752_007010 [Cryptotrichosporon argae]